MLIYSCLTIKSLGQGGLALKEKVMLHIEAYQLVEGQKEHLVSLDTVGFAYEEQDFLYLEYEETELIGVKGTTTQICLPFLDNKKVIIKRIGSSSMNQVYVKGEKYQTSYLTPYGEMSVELLPSMVNVLKTDTYIKITLSYDLVVSSQYVGQHQLNIEAKLNVTV